MNKMNKNLIKQIHNFLLIVFITLFLPVKNGLTAQFIDVVDGAEVMATISMNSHNRIKIIDDKVEGIIVGKNIIDYARHDKSGDVYISLSKRTHRPVDIFLIGQSGNTFKLLLLPKDIPAEQIFLVRKSPNEELKVLDDYQNGLVDFYKSISSGSIIKDYKITKSGRNYKIDDFKISFKSAWLPLKYDNFKGEIYEIKNKSKAVKDLNPQDFYYKGVRAIKFNSQTLQPKESTLMYIISISEVDTPPAKARRFLFPTSNEVRSASLHGLPDRQELLSKKGIGYLPNGNTKMSNDIVKENITLYHPPEEKVSYGLGDK